MGTTAAAEAALRVGACRDDPIMRLHLAASLYDRPGIRAYRRAEVAFMRWQTSRGVLAAETGSPWWRAVNEGLLRDGWEAALLLRGHPGEPSRPSVALRLAFLTNPSAAAWYRAHNASVVAGYLEHRELVEAELPLERLFMDVALARVLFAQCLVVDPRLALGRLWRGGRLLGDPRRRGADAFLSLRNILPVGYPLAGFGVEEVLAAENLLGLMIDYGVILPRMDAVYARAAVDLTEPRLIGLVRDGAPVYAWPYADRHVWRTQRAARVLPLVRSITAPPDGS